MSDIQLTITESGSKTIERMRSAVIAIADVFGDSSEEYKEIVISFGHALSSVLRLGGTISRDGDLSLFGSSFITYGVIFHAHDRTNCPECWAAFPKGNPSGVEPNDNCQRCGGNGTVEPTVKDVTNGVAVPGSWSVHS